MAQTRRFTILFTLLAATWSTSAPAQTSPLASRPTTRRAVIVPPGFLRVAVGSHVALCEPADEAWVRKALQTVTPATRPTTMPSDLIERIGSVRDALTRQMIADLGIERTAVDSLLDEKLLPSLTKLEQVNPPLFYLALTRTKLISLLKDGWEEPRFYYNRAANDVSFNMSVTLGVENNALDETILPALYESNDPEPARAAALARVVGDAEATIVNSVAERGEFLTQLAFIEFLGKDVVQPLKLRDDQQWFGLGLIGAMGAIYGGEASGVTRDDLIQQMTREHPRVPVKAAHVDLLHPTPVGDLRREYVPFYADAMRRKSTLVMSDWVEKVKGAGVRKTLDAMRAHMPPDGPALVKLIRQTTGEDLTDELAAK